MIYLSYSSEKNRIKNFFCSTHNLSAPTLAIPRNNVPNLSQDMAGGDDGAQWIESEL